MHTIEMEGPLVKIIPSMVCFPPVRHERSHIMYWNCGRNRLMSLSNVSRDGRAQSPSLPWIQLSKSAGVFL